MQKRSVFLVLGSGDARGSHIGGLDKGLDYAKDNNWTVVDMKNDWKVVYPFEGKK